MLSEKPQLNLLFSLFTFFVSLESFFIGFCLFQFQVDSRVVLIDIITGSGLNLGFRKNCGKRSYLTEPHTPLSISRLKFYNLLFRPVDPSVGGRGGPGDLSQTGSQSSDSPLLLIGFLRDDYQSSSVIYADSFFNDRLRIYLRSGSFVFNTNQSINNRIHFKFVGRDAL